MNILDFSIRHGSNSSICFALIKLLTTWCEDCPYVIQMMLESEKQVGLIVAVILGSVESEAGILNEVMMGSMAMMLGMFLLVTSPSNSSISSTGDKGKIELD